MASTISVIRRLTVRNQTVGLTYATDGEWPAEFCSSFAYSPTVEYTHDNEEHYKYHGSRHRWNIVPEVVVPFIGLENSHLEISFSRIKLGTAEVWTSCWKSDAKKKESFKFRDRSKSKLGKMKDTEEKMIETFIILYRRIHCPLRRCL
jgi:hypothetical protein